MTVQPSGSLTAAKTDRNDAWFASSCGLCYASCSTRVHRVNGVVVKIEGNPASAIGKGRPCAARASAASCSHYDPDRLRVPLRRTDPEEGVRPGSRLERDLLGRGARGGRAGHLRRIRAEDPEEASGPTDHHGDRQPQAVSAFAFGIRDPEPVVGRRRIALRQRRPCGQRHDACFVVDRAGLRVLQLRDHFGASKGHAAGHASAPTWERPPTPGCAA